MHRLSPSLKLILLGILIIVLAACGVRPIPSSTPLAVAPTAPVMVENSCWGEWQQSKSNSAFDCVYKEYQLAIEQYPTIAENHFRWGVLNWESGQK